MNKPCFSVIVLCYKHFEYIYTSINSVLAQDYENIELIISDDGSLNFPAEEIKEYIQKEKGANVVRYVVRQEAENCGTVKHLNHAIQCCEGDYIVALAGDDIFFDNTVLTRYQHGFSCAPKECLIEMAQTGMYDENLENLESYYLKLPVQKALEKTTYDTKELLESLLVKGPCLPSTSTCFKSEFFTKFGSFDEKYTLIEDYPMHLRLAKEGWVIHYENFVAIKHRHGGISHGQNGASAASSIAYYKDLKATIEDLMLPSVDVLPSETAEIVKQFQFRQLRWINVHLAIAQKDYTRLCYIGVRNPFHSLKIVLARLFPIANKIRTKLLIPCLVLWALIPTIAEMVNILPVQMFNHMGEQVAIFLYYSSGLMFVFWCISWLIWILNTAILKIQRFPKEVIAIG